MKTKEEIEQLAKKSNAERGIDSAKSMLEREYVLGYTNAYNQCQEDMADDLEAILNNSIYVDFISKKEIVKYLKSLNKQD
jgi:hypothetical protein